MGDAMTRTTLIDVFGCIVLCIVGGIVVLPLIWWSVFPPLGEANFDDKWRKKMKQYELDRLERREVVERDGKLSVKFNDVWSVPISEVVNYVGYRGVEYRHDDGSTTIRGLIHPADGVPVSALFAPGE